MKAIKFSESEMDFLKNHYELELLDAENYVGEIKNILKKLGVIEKEITKEKPVKVPGRKRGRPRKERPAEVEGTTPAPVQPVKKAKEIKAVKPEAPASARINPEGTKAEKKSTAKIAAKKPVKKVVRKTAKKAVKKAGRKPVFKATKAVSEAVPAPAEAAKPE